MLVCAHSKWIDVFPVHSADTGTTLEKLRISFAAWGVPEVLVSDNAQGFVSTEFETFCKVNGIRHLTTPCLSPKSNGAAEKAVDIFKRGLYKQRTGSVQTKVSRFLFRYRTTPQSTTQCTPAELFLGRVPRTHLDSLIPGREVRVREKQESQKRYKDQGSQDRAVSVGDKVFVSAVDNLRGLDKCRWAPGHVVCRDGLKLTVQLSDGRIIVRHADRVRKRYCAVSVSHDVNRRPQEPTPVRETAASPETPVTEATQLPVRSPEAEPLPDAPADHSASHTSCTDGLGRAGAAGPSPGRAAVSPRYSLRDRSGLQKPNRLMYR